MNDGVLASEILKALNDWRAKRHRPFDGAVIISIVDAKIWNPLSYVGEKGFIWGVPCRVENLIPGTFMLFDVKP